MNERELIKDLLAPLLDQRLAILPALTPPRLKVGAQASVQLQQQRSAPVVHGLGADRGHVAEGERGEQVEHLQRGDARADVAQHARVADVSAARGVAQDEVLAHQRGEDVDVVFGEPDAPADLWGERSTFAAVVTAAALADVVQESGQRQQVGAREVCGDAPERGPAITRLVGQVMHKRARAIHALHGVHIGRVDVVDVMLDVADERGELGDELSQDAKLQQALAGGALGAMRAEQVEQLALEREIIALRKPPAGHMIFELLLKLRLKQQPQILRALKRAQRIGRARKVRVFF